MTIKDEIGSALLSVIGSTQPDPDLLKRRIADAIAGIVSTDSVDVRVVEETQEEALIREVMEEPKQDVVFEATVTLNRPLNYITCVIESDGEPKR